MNKSQKRYPNLIIAGAIKCGTTSLFEWLGAHPEVCPSSEKETRYLLDKVIPLNKKANYHDHGLEKYEVFFRHCRGEPLRLEATPTYMHQKTALKVLSALKPKPTVIFMLRHPADRVYSFYKHQKYRYGKGHLENFADYVDQSTWVIRTGKYSTILQKWVQAMGRDHIKVYLFEHLRSEPQQFMQRVAEDLQVDPGFYADYDFRSKNVARAVKSHRLYQWGIRLVPYLPRWLKEGVLKPLNRKLNTQTIREEDRARVEEVKKALSEEYRPYNRELARLFDLDLSVWK